MRLSKKYAICLLLSFVLTGIMAMGAAPTDKPDKEPVDKITFVHYPKENPGNAFGKPDGSAAIGSGTGTLSKSYKYSGIHWADPTNITYYVNATANYTYIGAEAALAAAMATWDSASYALHFSDAGATNKTAGNDNDGYNVISWGPISYSNAIAVTYIWYLRNSKTIIECDTIMNISLPWSYTAPNVTNELRGKAGSDMTQYGDPTNSDVASPYAYDIQDIMTHEAGHWLMLGDLYGSQDSYLTMYGYGAKGELKKDTLGYGDELGVEYVYRP